MLPRDVVLALLLCTATAAVPQSTKPQESPNPVVTFKAKARLVLVDVVVTNGKGDSVSGLESHDFEVLENGKPQTIASFEEHKGAAPTVVKLPPMPPNVYTNFPVVAKADSLNVLLLDALNTPSSDQAYLHQQMIKYLKTIPPGTRVAIFTLASRLRMLQGVTSDSTQLLAVLNNDKALPHPSPLLPSTVESEANQRRVDFLQENQNGPTPSNPSMAQDETDVVNAEKEFLQDISSSLTEARTGITLQALQQLARYLSGVPGRKNVAWFSGSFPVALLPDPDLTNPFNNTKEFQQEIRRTADLLTGAQVAIYPVAAEGLATDTAFQTNGSEIGEKRGTIAMQDTIRQSQAQSVDRDSRMAAIDQIAKETGGQAFFNTNGLGDALSRVVNNGSHYYSLAYSPAEGNMDGKFRRIQVKLRNGKYNLAYRRGYYADDLGTMLTAGEKLDADPFRPLMGRNQPDYSQILFKVQVQPVKPQPAPDAPRAGSNADLKGPISRYGVDFAVAVDDLRLDTTTEGFRQGNIEVMLAAYDAEGKPVNLLVKRSEVRIPGKDYPGVQRGGLQIHNEIDLPSGYVFLRTGVYDLRSSKAGTLGVTIAASPSGK